MEHKEAITKIYRYTEYLSFTLILTGLCLIITLLDYFTKYFNPSLYVWFFGLAILFGIISLILYKKLSKIKKILRESVK